MLLQAVFLEVVPPGEALSAAQVVATERLSVGTVRSLVTAQVGDPGESLAASLVKARIWLFTFGQGNMRVRLRGG